MARSKTQPPGTDDDNSLTDYEHIAYYKLATIRRYELLNEQQPGPRFEDELEGLRALSLAKKIDFISKGPELVKFDVFNEQNMQIYLVESKRAWTQTKVQLCLTDGTPVLVMFCSNHGFACCSQTVITVTHKRKAGLGSVVYSGPTGVLYNFKREPILKVLKRTTADNKVEHAIVEIDNTRVGLLQDTSITFGDYIDTLERALLFGAWVPLGINLEISSGIFACLRKMRHVDTKLKDILAETYYVGEEVDEAEDAGHRRRRRRHHNQ